MKDKVAELNRKFRNTPPEEILLWFITDFGDKVAFSTSLGAEDQVITQMFARIKKPIKIFTLDTGRLFQETYDLLDLTQKKYGLTIEVYFPETVNVEKMVRSKGINLFYESIENRQQCCHIRKIEPLKRALAGKEVWITGMRKEQSVTRSYADLISWDPANEVIKVNPLIRWSVEQVWEYINTWNIPVNDLHAKGYPSIGCSPCTRAVKPEEDLRSGRWWWELPEFKECGLHKTH
ncbi:MAG: phosphoadenylyl-sulfate reductase [Bacteroidales bacterium]|nr:phosphoadenylyl-sulfate reductase [Bacteroidales bacterium]